MIDIRSLAGISPEELFNAFKEAFKDYEMQLNKDGLESMLKRRGFVPEMSFAAFDNDRIIAFTFNGIGLFNGEKTAYDTGTGTLEEYRGQGHASKIFMHSIPYLKEAGISQYLLEVLQHNDKAVSVYKKLGFEVSREFNYYSLKTDDIAIQTKGDAAGLSIKAVDLELAESKKEFLDFNPSWQNSFEAISRSREDFIILGAFLDQQFCGYGIVEPKSGDITQIAVDKKYRRKGIGTSLFKAMMKNNSCGSLKIINTDSNCETISNFLDVHSIPLSGKQYEMIKKL